MWKLTKPTLLSAKKDLQSVKNHCHNINENDVSDFECLYEEYDKNKGEISEEYHRSFINGHSVQSDVMHKQYKYLNEGQKLDYIRFELLSMIRECPYCGFGEPTTLDHYMPESKYKELATCRLNLVPLCWKCNHKKKDKDYQGFIHSYYQDFPKEVVFFKCSVDVKDDGAMFFKFYIDGTKISKTLKSQLENQTNTIELNKRLNKESISYITSNFFPDKIKEDNALKVFIKSKLENSRKRYGNNDWHTALLTGLYDNEDFNVKTLNIFINQNTNYPII